MDRGLVLLVAVALTGCQVNELGPENSLLVFSDVDSFEYSVIALDHVTAKRSYEWTTTNGVVSLSITDELSSGRVMLTLTDGGGTQVYREDLAKASSTTIQGVPGQWFVEVAITGGNGAFNFRLDSTP